MNEIFGAFRVYGVGECLLLGLVGNPGGKTTLGRSRLKREDCIKMCLQEVGCFGIDWIELAEETYIWREIVNGLMKLWVP